MNPILDAPLQSDQRREYAGFWIRVVASFIDGIVLSIANYIIQFAILGSTFVMTDFSEGLVGMFFIYAIVVFAIYVGYYVFLESSPRQATLGKMAVGIKVADENGQRISFATALGRFFSKILSALILYIGYIMVAFDSRKQGLHDRIAGTIVYYER